MANIHESVKFGLFCIIDGVPSESFHGFQYRESLIEIGEGTVIGHYVEIKEGAKIGSNQVIPSRSIG